MSMSEGVRLRILSRRRLNAKAKAMALTPAVKARSSRAFSPRGGAAAETMAGSPEDTEAISMKPIGVSMTAAATAPPDRIAMIAPAGDLRFLAMRIAIIFSTRQAALAFAKRPSRSEEHTSELQSLMRIPYAV